MKTPGAQPQAARGTSVRGRAGSVQRIEYRKGGSVASGGRPDAPKTRHRREPGPGVRCRRP